MVSSYTTTGRPMLESGKSYSRGRLSTVDLLVLTRLDELSFILRVLFTFSMKQTILMRRSTVLSLPTQLVFPALANPLNGI